MSWQLVLRLGLLGVVAWTLICTFVMALRLAYAVVERVRQGPLHSWLRDPERAAREYPAAYARFASTRAAYA